MCAVCATFMKCTIHSGLEVQMSLFCPSQVQIVLSICTLRHSSVYFLCKTKMANAHFVDFATHSLVVAYLHILIPLGHSMVNAPGAWEV